MSHLVVGSQGGYRSYRVREVSQSVECHRLFVQFSVKIHLSKEAHDSHGTISTKTSVGMDWDMVMYDSKSRSISLAMNLPVKFLCSCMSEMSV